MANEQNLKPWKPWQSGNPKGPKPGYKHLSTHIQEMLNDENFELKLANGEIFKGAPVKAIIKTAMIKAMKGDVKAFDILGKYGFGTKTDITTNGKDLPTPIIPLDVSTDNSD